jgi:hypothetical protein
LQTLAQEAEIGLALNLFVDDFVEVRQHRVVFGALLEIVDNAAKNVSHGVGDVVLRSLTAVRRSGAIEEAAEGVTPLPIKLYSSVKPVHETLEHAFLACVLEWPVSLISARHFLACLKVSSGDAL